MLAADLAIVALASCAAVTSVPLTIHAPSSGEVTHWPVTTGIPFPKGLVPSVDRLAIVARDAPVPAQFRIAATWEDGSARWVLADFDARLSERYAVSIGDGPARATEPDRAGSSAAQRASRSSGRASEATGGASGSSGRASEATGEASGSSGRASERNRSASRGSEGASDDLSIERARGELAVRSGRARYVFRDGDASFSTLTVGDRALVRGSGRAFYVVTSAGDRAELIGSTPVLEVEGRRHSVVRISGEYRTASGERVARGSADFHFYAGHEHVRVTHELIFDRDMNTIAFRDFGMSIPLAAREAAVEGFETKLGAIAVVQDQTPHFGKTESRFRILEGERVLREGRTAGDWLRVSGDTGALFIRVPDFAAQFPTAFRAAPDKVEIALWARESGRALDLRSETLAAEYFGHDWIPADHQCAQLPNIATGMARTHELYLSPSPIAPEIYASVDAAWVASSGAFGVMHHHDPERFPEAEAALASWFDRHVALAGAEFPATGFLYWGMHPYGAQPWEQKNGRWYPTLHRLARGLEYNLKRGVWVLYARSGDRRYRDFARRYTRFLRDVTFSHLDAPAKPKGWMAIGQFDCPIVWGQFGPKALKKAAAGEKLTWTSEKSALAFASSEDVIQFAYDYFLTGDLRSRDMARVYARALIEGTGGDVEKMIAAAGARPETFLRMIGSAYELDRAPELQEMGSRLLRALVREDGSPDPARPTQWGKWGEVFSAYYYYWVSTRDPLARKVLLRLAETQYRRGPIPAFRDRSSPLFEVFAIAAEDTGEAIYTAYLRRALEEWIALEKEKPREAPRGREMLTSQATINIGIPAALAALAKHSDVALPYVPVAVKPAATAKTLFVLEKTKPGAAKLDVYVGDPGARSARPRLLDTAGREAPISVAQHAQRVGKAEQKKGAGMSELYGKSGELRFYRLQFSAPPGLYTLDVGEDVEVTILSSEVDKVAQLAPEGLVLLEKENYFFRVPASAGTVEYFSSLPVEIFRGSERVPVESSSAGKYRFRASGVLRMRRPERLPAFVRMENIPFVVALGDANRLPSIDPPAPKLDRPPPPDSELTEGRFGEGIYLHNRFIETKVPGALPKETGTVEFWLRPFWSATDLPHERSEIRVELYASDPVLIGYWIDPNPDQSGDYNRASIVVQIKGAGPVRATEYLRAGKWYHLAVTWKIDGQDNEATIFIDGIRRTDTFHIKKLKQKSPPENLAPPTGLVRFGSAHGKAPLAAGETFDELRISKIVRYTDDFPLPKKPFDPDTHTALLLHFEAAAPATLQAGRRLQ